MKKLLLLAVLLPGCATISNISTMNRVLPQVQQLVFLQDYANESNSEEFQEICGTAPERQEIIRIAKLMGWTTSRMTAPQNPAHTASNCESVYYLKKK